jgi:thioredoxin 1
MQSQLTNNPGLFIVKLGAEWCGPCKVIEPLVEQYMHAMPENVQCAIIDVDESFELYAFFTKKRIVRGIPAILCYYSGNVDIYPDDLVIGADAKEVKSFFERCITKSRG